jgi:hypothetical protein
MIDRVRSTSEDSVMKRAALPIAIASMLTLAAPAGAVMLSPHGLGQVLFYPYYTVNDGQDTLLSLTNTDVVNAKVAKVRVKEGVNGRAVADFDVFLSPGDTWTGVVTQVGPADGGVIRTSDTSCTMPEIPAGGLVLTSAGYDGSMAGVPADDGPHGIERTREGYIEVIASADFTPGTATFADVTPSAPFDPGTGVPPNCAGLAAAQIEADASTPSPALFGSGAIINVGEGIYYGYAADALADFTSTPLYGTDGSPQLDQANTANTDGVRANVAVDIGALSNVPASGSGMIAADYDVGIDAVSAVLMRSNLSNEWLADPSLGALTDWVLTFPTKSWYVDKQLYPGNATNPFTEPFADGGSRVTVVPVVSDRAGGHEPGVSCPTTPPPGCYPVPPTAAFAVTTFSFRNGGSEAPSDVLGSTLMATTNAGPEGGLTPWGVDGWAWLDLASADGGHFLSPGIEEFSDATVSLNGLPAIGFMAYDIVNAHANPGLLANYGATFPHRSGAVQCSGCALVSSGASR